MQAVRCRFVKFRKSFRCSNATYADNKDIVACERRGSPAFGASPLFFFVSDELPDAEFSDVLKIIDHAYAVLGSIPRPMQTAVSLFLRD